MLEKLIVITGNINSGKTSLIKQLYGELKNKMVFVDGFAETKAKDFVGYKIEILGSDKTFDWAKRKATESSEKPPYLFFEDQVADIKQTLFNTCFEGDIFIFDEFGRRELQQKGLFPIFHEASKKYKILICVVQKLVLDNFIKQYRSNYKANLIYTYEGNDEKAIDEICSFL